MYKHKNEDEPQSNEMERVAGFYPYCKATWAIFLCDGIIVMVVSMAKVSSVQFLKTCGLWDVNRLWRYDNQGNNESYRK